jgi:hypothetical protein
MVLDLLFIMAHWHALAKLRLHTDISLDLMDDVTTALGHTLRTFEKATSSAFETHELRREAEARVRQQNRSTPPGTSSQIPDLLRSAPTPAVSSSSKTSAKPPRASSSVNARRPKKLNLNTYKHHALGDYTAMIRRYGTTDSYTTELVCNVSLISSVAFHHVILG